MAVRSEDHALMTLLDGHLDELEERIKALKSRMTSMVLEKYETRNQEILLSNMLKIRDDMAAYRKALLAKPDVATRDG